MSGGSQIVALSDSGRNQLSQFHCLELSPSEKARTRGVHQWQTGDRRNDSRTEGMTLKTVIVSDTYV